MARPDDDQGPGSRSQQGSRRWRRAELLRWPALVLGLAGCGGSDPASDAAPDTPPGASWWQPKLGEVKNWDVQLTGAVDVSAPRTMYELDLWALVPSPVMLDYGDGAPVTVPAGALAGTIAQLHARTPPAIVICHVEVGMLELDRPDARKFPGYLPDADNIPDNPTPPAPGSVIGWSAVPGVTIDRILDVREASRASWTSIMFKRFDLAKQIGCDGIAPGHSDAVQYPSGFPGKAVDSFSWYAEIARQGHDRMLSIGMKNGNLLAGQPDEMADKFDWLMIERCGEFDNCDSARPFIDLQKAVFAIDYDRDIDGVAQGSVTLCTRQTAAQIADGLYKDVALTSAIRTPCAP